MNSPFKTFKLEDGIPKPPIMGRTMYDFPFLNMKKGQSFLISKKESNSLRRFIQIFHKKNPSDSRHWTIRLIGSDQFRCWRVT